MNGTQTLILAQGKTKGFAWGEVASLVFSVVT